MTTCTPAGCEATLASAGVESAGVAASFRLFTGDHVLQGICLRDMRQDVLGSPSCHDPSLCLSLFCCPDHRISICLLPGHAELQIPITTSVTATTSASTGSGTCDVFITIPQDGDTHADGTFLDTYGDDTTGNAQTDPAAHRHATASTIAADADSKASASGPESDLRSIDAQAIHAMLPSRSAACLKSRKIESR